MSHFRALIARQGHYPWDPSSAYSKELSLTTHPTGSWVQSAVRARVPVRERSTLICCVRGAILRAAHRSSADARAQSRRTQTTRRIELIDCSGCSHHWPLGSPSAFCQETLDLSSLNSIAPETSVKQHEWPWPRTHFDWPSCREASSKGNSIFFES